MRPLSRLAFMPLFLFLGSIPLHGCSSDTAAWSLDPQDGVSRAYYHAMNLPASGVALEGYCPVAYFEANEPVRGSAEFPSDYGGVTYLFVNSGARELFEENPTKYLPAYGGWCAYGMAVEDKFPVDPTNFKIVDGRLLLFLKNSSVDARTLWEQGDEQEQLANADAHWRKVQG